jgi:hypothetical protein
MDAGNEIPLSESALVLIKMPREYLSDVVVEEESKSQSSPLAKKRLVDDPQRESPFYS